MDTLVNILIAGHHKRSHSHYQFHSELAKALMVIAALLIVIAPAVLKKFSTEEDSKTVPSVILICIGAVLMVISVIIEIMGNS